MSGQPPNEVPRKATDHAPDKAAEKGAEKGAEKPPDPRRIDLRALARRAGSLAGSLQPLDLPRLAQSVEAVGQAQWAGHGELRPVKGGESQVWLHLKARAPVQMICQRCLQSLNEDLRVERSFLFLPDEDEVVRLDEELEDDVLQLPRFFDLLQLVEDELILALPIVPRHEDCPQPLPLAVETDAVDAAAEAPHPFAALAALKKPARPN